MVKMDATNFKVIIVGGGPIGLTAAHVFSKLDIDFVLLERRDTVTPEEGSSLGIAPQTLRIFDQLGLLERVTAMNHPCHIKHIVTHGGTRYNTTYVFKWCEEDHGHSMYMLHRPQFLKTLYKYLPDTDKDKILTSKKVIDIETNENGVLVRCEDGTEIKGSVIIGADGVHSRVRREMRNLALLQDPKAHVNDENVLSATYRCMYGTTSIIPGLVPGESWGGHGSGASTQCWAGRDRAWFFVYEQLDRPRTEFRRYTDQDEADFVKKFADIAMTNKLKLRDLYEDRWNTGLTDLQEGTMSVFTWDRLAIVGDAVNKQTPNVGNGYNSGVQDLVVIASGLRRLLDEKPASEVDTEAIRGVLRQYQEARQQDAIQTCHKSANATRLQAWHTWGSWLTERWIVPYFKLDRPLFSRLAGNWISNGRVLPYLEEKSLKSGKVPWVHLPELRQQKLES